jgi:hypothetical protein
MTILSIDLAYKRYTDVGAIVLEQSEDAIRCEQLNLQLSGAPSAERLADRLDVICRQKNIRLILFDGPQGWKAPKNGLIHSRCCERELNTPAKTGEPFVVKPTNYCDFVKFSIATYDFLADRGWSRLPKVGVLFEDANRWLVESFPYSAWRRLGIIPLRSKAKSKADDITKRLEALRQVFPIEVNFIPSHDELQAIVAGLSGLAIERGDWQSCIVSGRAPSFEDNYWREGFIVNCVAAPISA